MGDVLIIDDDAIMAKTLAGMVKKAGHCATYAITLQEGIELAVSGNFDVVILDVRMPDGNGLEKIANIKEAPSRPEVIIITADGDPDGAELAIRCGAWDYLQKSPSIKDILLPLARVFQYQSQKQKSAKPTVLKREKIIGNSPKMQACIDLLAQAAACDVNVLVTGETGTGKELLARAIHDNSKRCRENFVVVDCATIPETLAQSILFGHRKGAFTSADQAREGLIAQADGGTLFLDEIGELGLEIQKSFLRVLQERSFRPLGGTGEKTSGFRLIAATNKNLDGMVENGGFREDLLFRLKSLAIDLPPLRERTDDIKALTIYHVSRLCEKYRRSLLGFSPDFFETLLGYEWPGNVRELVNTLDAAVALAGSDPTLFYNHLPTHIRAKMTRTSILRKNGEKTKAPDNPMPERVLPKLKEYRNKAEKQYLMELCRTTQFNTHAAIQISGVSKSRLYELIAKHNIGFPKFMKGNLPA